MGKTAVNVKCNCGHTAKAHTNSEGQCKSWKTHNGYQCGCTWYYPNDKWILKQQKKKLTDGAAR